MDDNQINQPAQGIQDMSAVPGPTSGSMVSSSMDPVQPAMNLEVPEVKSQDPILVTLERIEQKLNAIAVKLGA